MVTKIVLTGGTRAGKSTVLAALRQTLKGKAEFADEAATVLWETGTPKPNIPGWEWKYDRHLNLQRAILAASLGLEAAAVRRAQRSGAQLVILDRGPLDCLAYAGGLGAILEVYRVPSEPWADYDLVIHLESLATADPQRFEQIRNPHQYEDTYHAQWLERQTRDAWRDHPNWVFVPGNQPIEAVIARVTELVLPYLP
jgi:thymidylate kinase